MSFSNNIHNLNPAGDSILGITAAGSFPLLTGSKNYLTEARSVKTYAGTTDVVTAYTVPTGKYALVVNSAPFYMLTGAAASTKVMHIVPPTTDLNNNTFFQKTAGSTSGSNLGIPLMLDEGYKIQMFPLGAASSEMYVSTFLEIDKASVPEYSFVDTTPTTVATALFTAPTGKKVLVSNLRFTNLSTDTNSSVTFYVVPSAGSVSSTNKIYATTINTESNTLLTNQSMILSSGESLSVVTGDATIRFIGCGYTFSS